MLRSKILICADCGYISRHWNGKINLFMADFDGTDNCPKCKGVMKVKPYEMGHTVGNSVQNKGETE